MRIDDQISTVDFYFRVWVHPEDSDPAEVEVWWQGIEPTEPRKRFVSDWALESLQNEDLYQLFDLDKSKHWQVVGMATLKGWFDADGEYDETLSLIEFKKSEVPDSWYIG